MADARDAPTSSPNNWSTLLLVGVIAGALAFYVFSSVRPGSQTLGQPLPPLNPAGWLDENSLTAEQLQGKVLVIDAWASWCGPCIRETQHLMEVYARVGENPRVQFLGITMQTAAEIPAMEKFVERLKVPWPNAFGAEDFFTTLAIDTIPRVYVVSPQGNIIWSNLSGGDIEDAISQALTM